MQPSTLIFISALCYSITSCTKAHLSANFTINNSPTKMIIDTGASTSLLPLSYSPQETTNGHTHFSDRSLTSPKGHLHFSRLKKTTTSPCIFTNASKYKYIAGIPLLKDLHPHIITSPHPISNKNVKFHTSSIHQLPLIPCKIGPQSAYMLLDTGSLSTIINSEVTTSTNNSNSTIGARHISLADHLPPFDSPIAVSHIPSLSKIRPPHNRQVIGILGLDYIRKNISSINLTNQTLSPSQ